MLVSVVITTDNRLSHLKNLVSSLRFQDSRNFEVIVVAGPTPDGTLQYVNSLGPSVRLARCDERNISKARNAGIAIATGEIVAFIDDDAIPEPSWTTKIARAFANPKLGVFGGALRDHTGFSYQAVVSSCDRFGDAYTYSTVDEAMKRGVVQSKPKASQFFSPTGANSAFRRQALLEVGGFDELFAYFLDETDVTLRILERGWQCTYDTSCEVTHRYAPSTTRISRNIPASIFSEVRSKVYFILRHAKHFYRKKQIEDTISLYEANMQARVEGLYSSGQITLEHAQRLKDELRSGSAEARQRSFLRPALADFHMTRCVDENVSDARNVGHPSAWQKPIKLVVVCRRFLDERPGGIAVWIKSAAEELARKGVLITIVCESKSGRHEADFANGFFIHSIPLSSFYDGPQMEVPNDIWHWSITAFEEALRLRYIRGVDLVLAPIWDVEGIAFARSKIFPLITSMHTTYSLSLPWKRDWNENANYRLRHVNKVIDAEYEVFLQTDYILANSNAIIDDFLASSEMSVSKRRYSLVPHGIKINAMPPKDYSSTLRILFVGRFEKRKGIDTAVHVFKRLLEQPLDVHIDVVGHADHNDEVASKALDDLMELSAIHGDRIRVHGYVTDEQLNAFYSSAQVFLAPSRYESFGLIYIEAMNYGCVPIGCRTGGVREVIDERDGFLVDLEDDSAIVVAIETLYRDRELLERMSINGKLRCDELFSNEKMGTELYHFLLECLNS